MRPLSCWFGASESDVVLPCAEPSARLAAPWQYSVPAPHRCPGTWSRYQAGDDAVLPRPGTAGFPNPQRRASDTPVPAYGYDIGMLLGLAFFPFPAKPSAVYGWMSGLATLAVIIADGTTTVAASLGRPRAA